MSFLPVVDRELRVASRRWTTFWVRAGVGLLALLISVPTLLFGWMAGGNSGAGQGSFTVLSNYVFVLALLGGLLITADCLSAEKREGTLGLLFLTDLTGHDVVLGKFAALGLHAMYWMVAVFPALAIPLLIGGVTGGEFWRVALALLNLLFVSLSAGMLVSSLTRESDRAFLITLILLLCLVAGLPLSARLLEWAGAGPWVGCLEWLNPGQAFSAAKAAGRAGGVRDYWTALGVSHGLAWACLIGAGAVISKRLQDTPNTARQPGWISRTLGAPVARIFRVQRPRAGLESDPILWLMGERSMLRIILWCIAGTWCVCVVAICMVQGVRDAAGLALAWSFLVLFLFALALVEHSCRFWVESRQNGNLEALLAIPLSSRSILASHWSSIRGHFLWPVVLVLCAATLPSWVLVGSALLAEGDERNRIFEAVIVYVYLGGMLVWYLATFAAIGYTGVWFALKLRRPQYAGGLTLLCVVLLPMMFCWLGFGVTLLFILLPMSFLQTGLRGMIFRTHGATDRR